MKNKKLQTFLLYTALFSFISIIIFAVFFKTKKVLIFADGDAFQQHFLIFNNYIKLLKEGSFNIFDKYSTFSWNIGLGSDILGQYSYYIVGDLFAYIGLLFPMKNIDIAYSIAIIFRIYFTGISFLYFCKYKNIEMKKSCIGAIVYAFSSWVLYASVIHPYFTNAAILFPVFLVCIEKLVKENKILPLTIINTITIISNFYFWYKISILAMIYFLIIYFLESESKSVKNFSYQIFKVAFSYVVSICLSSLVFLPTLYTYISSSRLETNTILNYGKEYYKDFLIGISSFTIDNWTTITTTTLTLLFFPLFIKKYKQNKSICIFTLIIVLMLLSPVFGSIMNGFSYPTNRFSFALCFCAAYIVCTTIKFQFDYSWKDIILMSSSMIIYLIFILLIGALNKVLLYAFVPAICFLLIAISKRVFNMKFSSIINKFGYVLTIIVIVMSSCYIGLSMYYGTCGDGMIEEFKTNSELLKRYNTLNGRVDNYSEIIGYLKSADKSFYRISTSENSISNIPLLFNYSALSSYLSLVNGNVFNLSSSISNLELSASSPTKEFNNRTRITTLLSTKYFIIDEYEPTPIGYTFYKKIGKDYIYINNHFVGPISYYSKKISKENYSNLTAYEKEQAIFSGVYIESDKQINLEELKFDLKDNILDYEILDSEGLLEKEGSINVVKPNSKLTLKINNKVKGENELYLEIKNLIFNSSNLSNNEFVIEFKTGDKSIRKKVEDRNSRYYSDISNMLINLGKVNESNLYVDIVFKQTGKYSFNKLSAILVDFGSYNQQVDNLNSGINNIRYNNNSVEADLNLEKAGILQLSTGYSKGWKVYIDGCEGEVLKANEAFVGTFVEKGKHNIKFVYQTPYRNLSLIMTLIGIISIVIIVYIERKCNICYTGLYKARGSKK